MNLATFAVILGLPVILRLLSSSGSSKRKREHAPGPSSKYASIGLLIYAAYLVLQLVQPPTNLLSDLNCDAQTPAYMLRNAFRHYKTARDFESTDTSALSVAMQNDELLYERLLLTTNRKIYLSFGHTAFTKCKWCIDDVDFAFYALPSILSLYCTTFLALGLASFSRSKAIWRMYGIWLLGLLAIAEIALFCYDVDEVILPVRAFKNAVDATYDDMSKLRLWYMFGVVSFASIWSTRLVWSETEILKEILDQTSEAYNLRQGPKHAR